MKTLPTYILALCLLLAAASAQAGRTFLVQQDINNDGDFLDTIGGKNETFGRFTSFQTSYTIEQFYGYIVSGADPVYDDGLRDDSYGGDLRGFWGVEGILSNNDLVIDQSHLFLVQATDGLGLFIVHNKMRAGGSGGSAEMEIIFSNAGEFKGLSQEDDDGNRADDEYDYTAVTGDTVLAQWQWGPNYSDGLAAEWSGGHLNYVDIGFADLSSADNPDIKDDVLPADGLDSWVLLSEQGSQSMSVGTSQPVRLTLVPLPPAAWPAVAVLGVLALRKLRTRRLSQSEQLR
jgi:hypothetical protein